MGRDGPAAVAGGERRRKTPRAARAGLTFQPPAVSRLAVPRRRILSLLDLALHQRLTIIVAPPGYGKTVLLSQWVAAHPKQRVRWLTVGSEDNDPALFARQLRGALDPSAGAGAADAAGADGSAVTILGLLPELERMPPTILVLDDLHAVTNTSLLDDLATLIEHAPRSLRIVVATRVDPPLRYYRLCLSDALVELRQEDLAFTADEAAELVRRITGWELERSQIDKLVARTEGWAVGLQLAALSLGDRSEVDAFLDAFAGDDRHVADYLTEQVLQRLPPGVRDFVLATSVLERMSGSLCDFVTGGPGGQSMLDELERRSVFITTLDAGHRWFRYHPLLRTLLRQHLHEQDPRRERVLLRRAAEWHRERADVETAVRYLADAGAWDDVLESAYAFGRDMLERGRAATVASWIDLVPVAAGRQDARALLVAAAGWAIGGDALRAGEILDAAGATGATGALPAGDRAVATLVRAYAYLQQGLPRQAAAAAEQALSVAAALDGDDVPDVLGLTGSRDDVVIAAHGIRDAALVYQGRLEEARRAFDAAPKGGHALWQVSGLGSRALLEAWAGRLGIAEQLGTRALSVAGQFGMEQAPATIDAYLALAGVARERDELPSARAHLAEAKRRSRQDRRGLVEMLIATEEAMLALAEGQPAVGLTILAARRTPDHPPMPEAVVARRRAVEAQLLIMSEEYDGADRALDLAPEETSDVVAARVRLAVERDDLDSARHLIERWPEEPEPRAPLERALWQAITEHLQDDDAAARARMLTVLAEAERDGNVALFRGHHALRLARTLYRDGPTPFLRAIVDQPAAARTGPVKELVEQLTEREYMVLPLLPTRLSNVEIAETLGVSLNTVKTHLKHIYRKLGVTERSDAIAVAERLHLW